jgi:phosphatidylglycerophosphate synthase
VVYPDMHSVAKMAALGFAGGALLGVLAIFLGFRLNLKGVRTVYTAAGVEETRALYKASAIWFGAMIAAAVALLPVLDVNRIKDPYTGLILIAGMLPFMFLYARAVKRLRGQGSPKKPPVRKNSVQRM